MIISLILIISSQLWAVDYRFQVQEISSSGKSIILPVGGNEGVVNSELAILIRIAPNDTPLKLNKTYRPVAKIKNIKVNKLNSYWIVVKKYGSEVLDKKQRYYFLSESIILRGRNGLEIDRSNYITNKNPRDDTKNLLLESSDELSQKKDNYRSSKKLKEKNEAFNKDVTIVDLYKWQEFENEDTREDIAIYKSPLAKDFRLKKQIDSFEKIVAAYLLKINDPNFDIDTFYKLQRKGPGGINVEPTTHSLYRNYVLKEEKRMEKLKEISKETKKKGPLWSQNMSDEQLEKTLYEIGVADEIDRRSNIITTNMDKVYYFQLGLNLVGNDNEADVVNTGFTPISVGFAAEWFVFKKYKTFDRFSLEGSLRYSNDLVSTGFYNANSTEFSFAGQLNFYPFNYPNEINKNILFLGVRLRSGVVNLSVDSTGDSGNYSILSFPGIVGGVKYNFQNSYGLRLDFGYENISANRIEVNDPSGVLSTTTNYVDAKLGIALSKFY